MSRFETIERYWYLLVPATVLLVYGMTFFNAWTYDDMYVVVNNSDTFSLNNFLHNSYPGRPLRELTHLAERKLFGIQPAGYHILQLLLHTLNGVLLFIIIERCGVTRIPALFGVLLFLVHPFQSESVANIGHRKELLALFFCCLSVIAFQQIFKVSDHRRHGLMLVSAGMFCVALTGNETALSLPLAWLAYEYHAIPRDKAYLTSNRPALITFVILVFAYASYRIMPFIASTHHLTALYFKNNFFDDQAPLLPHILGIFTVFFSYCTKIMLPCNLAPEYVIPLSKSLFQPFAVAGMAIIIVLMTTAIRVRKTRPVISFGILWFLILYLPISNIIPVGYSMADRYMYMPLAGLGIAVAGLLESTPSARAPMAAWVVILSLLTVVQNRYWRNEFALWEHAVTVNPQSSVAQESAAHSAMLNGDLALARTRISEAIRLNPYNSKLYFTRAMVDEISGNDTAAIRSYQIFLQNSHNQPLEKIQLARQKLNVLQLKSKPEPSAGTP